MQVLPSGMTPPRRHLRVDSKLLQLKHERRSQQPIYFSSTTPTAPRCLLLYVILHCAFRSRAGSLCWAQPYLGAAGFRNRAGSLCWTQPCLGAAGFKNMMRQDIEAVTSIFLSSLIFLIGRGVWCNLCLHVNFVG